MTDDEIVRFVYKNMAADKGTTIQEVVSLPLIASPTITVRVPNMLTSTVIQSFFHPTEESYVRISPGGPSIDRLHTIFQEMANGAQISNDSFNAKLKYMADRYPQWSYDVLIGNFHAVSIDGIVYTERSTTLTIEHAVGPAGYSIFWGPAEGTFFEWSDVRDIVAGRPFRVATFVAAPLEAQNAALVYITNQLRDHPEVQIARVDTLVESLRHHWKDVLKVYCEALWDWLCNNKVLVTVGCLTAAAGVIIAVSQRDRVKDLFAKYTVKETPTGPIYDIYVPGVGSIEYQSGTVDGFGRPIASPKRRINNRRAMKRNLIFDDMERLGVPVRDNPNKLREYREAWIDDAVERGGGTREEMERVFPQWQSLMLTSDFQSGPEEPEDLFDEVSEITEENWDVSEDESSGDDDYQAVKTLSTFPISADPQLDVVLERVKEGTCYVSSPNTGMGARGLFVGGRYVLCNSHLFPKDSGAQTASIYDDTMRKEPWIARVHNTLVDRDIVLLEVTNKDFVPRKNLDAFFVRESDIDSIDNIRVYVVSNNTDLLMGGSGRFIEEPAGLYGQTEISERGFSKDRRNRPFPTFSIHWVHTGDIPTRNGQCGSVYVTAAKRFGARRIFAIHSIGSSNNGFTRGAVVSVEDLEALRGPSAFQSASIDPRVDLAILSFERPKAEIIAIDNPLPAPNPAIQAIREKDAAWMGFEIDNGVLVSTHDKDHVFDIDATHRFTQLGFAATAYRPASAKTKIRRSVFSPFSTMDDTTTPSAHSYRQLTAEVQEKLAKKGGVPSLLGTQLRPIATTKEPMDSSALLSVEDFVFNKFSDVFGNYTVLNDHEVRNGVRNPNRPLFSYVHPIDPEKSVGSFGIPNKKLKKGDYFQKAETPEGTCLLWDDTTDWGLDLHEFYRDIDRCARVGIHLVDPIEVRLKDELLPTEKRNNGKVRLFENVSLATFLFQRKYLSYFLAQSQKHRFETPWVTGYNPREETVLLYSVLRRKSMFGENGDAEKYDKSMPYEVQESGHSLLSRWACLSENQTLSAETITNIFKTILSQNTRELHMAEGVVYWTNSSFNSGCVATNFLDGLFGIIMRYYVALMILRLAFPEKTDAELLVYADKNMTFLVNGDDIICAITDEASIYLNFNSFRDQYKKFGIIYTLPTKDGDDSPDRVPLSEMDFSSRSFRLDGTLVYGPLKRSSIERQFHWTKADRGNINMLVENFESILSEAFLWGREYYTHILNEIQTIRMKYLQATGERIPISPVGYNTYRTAFLETLALTEEETVKRPKLSGIEISHEYQALINSKLALPEMYSCNDCGYSCKNERARFNHVVNSHPKSRNEYQCPGDFCSYKGTIGKLLGHESLCLWTGRAKCLSCKNSFDTYAKAANHHLSCHARNSLPIATYFAKPHSDIAMLERTSPGEPGIRQSGLATYGAAKEQSFEHPQLNYTVGQTRFSCYEAPPTPGQFCGPSTGTRTHIAISPEAFQQLSQDVELEGREYGDFIFSCFEPGLSPREASHARNAVNTCKVKNSILFFANNQLSRKLGELCKPVIPDEEDFQGGALSTHQLAHEKAFAEYMLLVLLGVSPTQAQLKESLSRIQSSFASESFNIVYQRLVAALAKEIEQQITAPIVISPTELKQLFIPDETEHQSARGPPKMDDAKRAPRTSAPSSGATVGGANSDIIPRAAPSAAGMSNIGPVSNTTSPETAKITTNGVATPTMTVSLQEPAPELLPGGVPGMTVFSGPANKYEDQLWRMLPIFNTSVTSTQGTGTVLYKFIYGTEQCMTAESLQYTRAHSQFGGSHKLTTMLFSNANASGTMLMGWMPHAPGYDENNQPTIADLYRHGVIKTFNIQGTASDSVLLQDIRKESFYRDSSEILDAENPENWAELARRPRFYLVVLSPVQSFTAAEIAIDIKVFGEPHIDWEVNNFNGFPSSGGPSQKYDLSADFLARKSFLAVDGTSRVSIQPATGNKYSPGSESFGNNTVNLTSNSVHRNWYVHRPVGAEGSATVLKKGVASGLYSPDLGCFIFGSGTLPDVDMFPFATQKRPSQLFSSDGIQYLDGSVDLVTWMPANNILPNGWTVTSCDDALPDTVTIALNINYKYGRYFRFQHFATGLVGTLTVFFPMGYVLDVNGNVGFAATPAVIDRVARYSAIPTRSGLKQLTFASNTVNAIALPDPSATVMYRSAEAAECDAYILGWISASVENPNNKEINFGIKANGAVIGQVDMNVIPGSISEYKINSEYTYARTTWENLTLTNPIVVNTTHTPEQFDSRYLTEIKPIQSFVGMQRALDRIAAIQQANELPAEEYQSASGALFGVILSGALEGAARGAGGIFASKIAFSQDMKKMAYANSLATRQKMETTAAGRRYAASMTQDAQGAGSTTTDVTELSDEEYTNYLLSQGTSFTYDQLYDEPDDTENIYDYPVHDDGIQADNKVDASIYAANSTVPAPQK